MSLGNDLIGYLGGLTLAGGDHDGSRFEVLSWQRRFLRGAFCRPGNSALSVARGNGKSALVAAVATAVVDPGGPLHGNRHHVICAAASFEQSRIIFTDVVGFLKGQGHDLEDRKLWRKQDSANRAILEYRPTEALIRCIGNDPATAHGLRPLLILCDEPSQWEPAQRDKMLAALDTSLGKMRASRLIALGTRSAVDGHWFSKMLEGGEDYAQVHAAGSLDPPFRLSTWRKANPSLDHLPSLLAKLREREKLARQDPAMLAAFRALRLNLGVDDVESSLLLSHELWEELASQSAEPDGAACWGVDLGTSAASSAVAAFWPATGLLRCVAAFPTEPPLGERGLRDGVGSLYVDSERRGELIAVGGEAVHIGGLMAEALARFGRPAAVACDAWRLADLRDAMAAIGLRGVPTELRRMGPKDGSEDVRAFRRACLERRVHPTRNVFLASAVGVARTISDPAGNQRLCKGSEGGRRMRARDDAAAASILAVSLAERNPPRESSGIYLGLVG